MSPTTTATDPKSKRRVTLDRTFQAPIEDVWDLWTTKDGIESWWGPEGFRVEVLSLDLRVGGDLVYAMIAVGEDQIAYMKKAGMPLRTQNRQTYTEIEPLRRLGYTHLVDFVPDVETYWVDYLVEMKATPDGVRMLLTFDAMHSDHWTQMATMGWESELGKLAKVLSARARRG